MEKQTESIVKLLGEMQKDVEALKAKRPPMPVNEPLLKGLRTKIVGWVTALAPAAAMLGYQYDPELIISFINDFSEWIMVGYIGLGTAIHKFRNQA